MADSSAIVAGRRMSSSADLSSPPISPKSPVDGDSIVVLTTPSGQQQPTPSSSTTQPPVKQEPPAKPKRIRKPKIAADGTEITPKPRKSRAKKKDPVDSTSATTTTPASTSKPVVASQATSKAPRQSKINELMSPAPPVQQNPTPEIQTKSDPIGNKVEAIQNTKNLENTSFTTQPQQSLQQTNIKQDPVLSSYAQPTQPSSSTSRGQNYDPIRSSTITASSRSITISGPSTPSTTPKPAVRASTSPSIASLMNPSTSSDPPLNRPSSSLSPVKPASAQLVQPVPIQVPQSTASPIPTPAMPRVKPPTPPIVDAMEIDAKPTVMSRITSQSSNSAPSTGPSKLKEKALVITPKLPPLPGQGFGTAKESGARAIVIDVPLVGQTYKCIDFQKLAVEKYGFNAVYPKLALQREHLARVAANVAALERKAGGTTSNDEMSIDGSDNEAELSTGSKRKAPAGPEEPVKKKRLTYEDQYDPEDGFIDDTEATWEQTAAAVQDGFFVYSGDLIQKEEPKPEKADGAAAKKKPRTSKGGAAARTTAAKTTKDKADEDKKDPKTMTTATNGSKEVAPKKPAAPRKRYTKEEQAERKAAREKLAREKAAATAAAAGNVLTTTTASTTPTPSKTVAPGTPIQAATATAAAVPSPA